MKQIYIIATLLLISVGAAAQKGKDIYNKWSDSEGVSAVYISPAMFRMIGKLPEIQVEVSEGQSMDIAPLINSLEGFYLLDIDHAKIRKEDLMTDIGQMTENGKYELMMELKEDGENVRIYTKGGEIIKSLLFFCRSAEDSQFICIDGAIRRSDLEAMMR